MSSPARYLLHIGRHKTGTSSLQRFLHVNREPLEAHGFYYPTSGVTSLAHHDIARHFFKSGARLRFTAREREQHANAFRNMMREVANRSDVAMLSSEGFQNCNPIPLARALGPGHTRIVVYIREQVEYLISAYQQKVHATNYSGSLLEFAEGFSVNYDAFLKHWEQAFGQAFMCVRTYGKKSMKDGDVIADFCQCVGITDDSPLVHPGGDQNPSIGGPLLELKRRINSFSQQQTTDPRLYRALSQLAATTPAYRARPSRRHRSARRITCGRC